MNTIPENGRMLTISAIHSMRLTKATVTKNEATRKSQYPLMRPEDHAIKIFVDTKQIPKLKTFQKVPGRTLSTSPKTRSGSGESAFLFFVLIGIFSSSISLLLLLPSDTGSIPWESTISSRIIICRREEVFAVWKFRRFFV